MANRRQRDQTARVGHLLQVDLQPNHEEQQDQPYARDGINGVVIGYPAESVRSNGESADQVRQQQRLPQNLERHRKDPC